MAQLLRDFSAIDAGAALSGATLRRGAVESDYAFAEISGMGALQYRNTSGAATARALSLTAVPSAGVTEIHSLLRDSATSPNSGRLVAFAQDAPDSEYGCFLQAVSGATQSFVVYKRVGGSYSALPGAGSGPVSSTAFFHVRMKVTPGSPNRIQAKYWTAGAEEPVAWNVDTTDNALDLSAGGWTGVVGFDGSGKTVDYRVISIGTGGDPAPAFDEPALEPETPRQGVWGRAGILANDPVTDWTPTFASSAELHYQRVVDALRDPSLSVESLGGAASSVVLLPEAGESGEWEILVRHRYASAPSEQYDTATSLAIFPKNISDKAQSKAYFRVQIYPNDGIRLLLAEPYAVLATAPISTPSQPHQWEWMLVRIERTTTFNQFIVKAVTWVGEYSSRPNDVNGDPDWQMNVTVIPESIVETTGGIGVQAYKAGSPISRYWIDYLAWGTAGALAPVPAPVPAAPSSVNAVSGSESVNATWDAVDGAVDYEVRLVRL